MQTVMDPPDEFVCEVRPDRESVVVRLAGELDLRVAGDVAAIVEELLDARVPRIVVDLRALSFRDGSVGTALCLDTLEHCADPPQACRELARVCSPDGGVAVISSVMLFGIHEHPHDYFRFTPDGFRALLEQGFDDVWVAGIGDPGIPVQVVGVGIRAARRLSGRRSSRRRRC